MGLFDKSNEQTDFESNVTIIAAGSKVTGQIDIQCELHIDGHVEGNINSTKKVQIGQTGHVQSNIRAEKLIIAGTFSGSADCNEISLLDGCNVQGKLMSDSLAISPKGSFEGQSLKRAIQADGQNVIDVKENDVALSDVSQAQDTLLSNKS